MHNLIQTHQQDSAERQSQKQLTTKYQQLVLRMQNMHISKLWRVHVDWFCESNLQTSQQLMFLNHSAASARNDEIQRDNSRLIFKWTKMVK